MSFFQMMFGGKVAYCHCFIARVLCVVCKGQDAFFGDSPFDQIVVHQFCDAG